MSTNVQHLTISANDVDQRIDNFLRARLKGLPKSRLYKALRKGEVRVNKKRIGADYRLQQGDVVRVPPLRLAPVAAIPRILSNQREQIQQAIVAEHADFLVINKPHRLSVHRGTGVEIGLIDIVQALFPKDDFLQLAHRLDKETSGCILIARNRLFLRHFQQQLRAGDVEKKYQAWVVGHWQRGKCTIDAPLQRDTYGSERIVRVEQTPQAKHALTEVKPVKCQTQHSQLEIRLLTGRTHQIRVHLAHYQHPIIGDEKYGDQQINASYRARGLTRLALHAASLGFTLSNGKWVSYQAPIPENLARL